MQNLKFLIMTSALALLAAGCALRPVPTALIPTLEPSTAGPTAPATAEESGRYLNEEAGISLVLPLDWSASGPYPVSVGETSYNLYLLGLDPSPNAGPGVSRLIVAEDDKLSIEAFILSQCSTCPSLEIADATLNGIPIQRTVIGGGGVPFEVEWNFLDRGGRLVGLSVHGPQTMGTLNDVLQTLHLE